MLDLIHLNDRSNLPPPEPIARDQEAESLRAIMPTVEVLLRVSRQSDGVAMLTLFELLAKDIGDLAVRGVVHAAEDVLSTPMLIAAAQCEEI